MALLKKFIKNKQSCKVTFSLPREAAENAQQVDLLGDFNDWQAGADPMRKTKDGGFTISIELASGRDYQFRYLLDRQIWINDWEADRYEFSPIGNCENSVVSLT